MYHTPNQHGIGKLKKIHKNMFPKVGDYVRVINKVDKTEIVYKVLTKPCCMYYNENPVQECEVVIYHSDRIYKYPWLISENRVGEKEFVTLILDNKCPHANYKYMSVKKLENKELMIYLL